MQYKVGVIGNGFVGNAVIAGLENTLKDKIDIRVYDKFQDTESLDAVVTNSNILFLCLPTPMNFETGECDLSIVDSIIKEIDAISHGKSIVVKSTVPPGTTRMWAEKYPNHNWTFSPEFLTEKNFIKDFLEQDRIFLGAASNQIGYNNEVYCLFYEFVNCQKKPAVIKIVTSTVSEMVKYMGNCFLATKISFCNEMYQICQAADIEYDKVAKLVAMDKRIGSSHMKVPCEGDFGFSKSCLPKDLNSLIFFAKSLGVDTLILESVWSKNLLVRKNYDWEKLAQVNGKYTKK